MIVHHRETADGHRKTTSEFLEPALDPFPAVVFFSWFSADRIGRGTASGKSVRSVSAWSSEPRTGEFGAEYISEDVGRAASGLQTDWRRVS
jgi:hypothetical protein